MFALLDLCLFLWIDQQCPLVCLGDACCWYLGRQNLPSVAVFFDDHIEVMVYSNQYQLDPKTATRPLEDDQPLGAVPSLRVILPFPTHPADRVQQTLPGSPRLRSVRRSCSLLWRHIDIEVAIPAADTRLPSDECVLA
jgi:hypothetical protein